MVDTAALTTELEELKTARSQLLRGEAVEEIRREAGTVKFTPANLPALNLRIREIESALGLSGRRRPFGVAL